MVGVRRSTGRARTGPIEGLVGQRSDLRRTEWGDGGEERKGRLAERARTERTSLGPEDRPSKLSHALSVLRKRRIGVVLRYCFQEERGSGREGYERGAEVDDRSIRKR